MYTKFHLLYDESNCTIRGKVWLFISQEMLDLDGRTEIGQLPNDKGVETRMVNHNDTTVLIDLNYE